MGTAFAVVVVAASGAKTGPGHAAAWSRPWQGISRDYHAGYATGKHYSGSVVSPIETGAA